MCYSTSITACNTVGIDVDERKRSDATCYSTSIVAYKLLG